MASCIRRTEGLGSTWWLDEDGDGFGDEAFFVVSCDPPSDAFTNEGGDCDDDDPLTFPDADEDCEDVDRNCDDDDADVFPLSPLGSCEDSCATILAWNPAAGDGTYAIDPDGPNTGKAPFDVTCDMSGGGWTRIHNEDFESTVDPDWSTPVTTTCGSTNILGGYFVTATTEQSNTFDTLGIAHSDARVAMAYYTIDDWENNTAYVKIDGTTVFSTTWGMGAGTVSICGKSNMYYDKIHAVDKNMAHTASTVTVTAGSTLPSGPEWRSYGIDDVSVWVR